MAARRRQRHIGWQQAATGSIAYAAALRHCNFDNNIARLATNVLRRFADPKPFPPPPRT